MELLHISNLADIEKYLDSKKIVCLYPKYWSKFSNHFKKKINSSHEFPKPLILSGWAGSNNYELRKRFIEQLEFILMFLDISTIKSYLTALVLETHYLTYEEEKLNPVEFSPLSNIYIDFEAQRKVIAKTFPYLKKLYEHKKLKMSEQKLIDLMFRFEEHGINKRKKWKDESIEKICIALYSIYKEQLSLQESHQGLYEFCQHIFFQYEDTLSDNKMFK